MTRTNEHEAEAPEHYYWVTIVSTHYGREKSEYRESYAIDALPFTWFRMYERCESKQRGQRRPTPDPYRLSYELSPDHRLDDFRRISKEEYTDAAENEQAQSMASLQAWYDSIGKEAGETARFGPYR